MTHEHITVMKQCIYLQMTSFFFMLSSRKNQNFRGILRYIEGRYSYKKLKCIQLETIVLSQKKVETNQDQYLKEVVKFFQLDFFMCQFGKVLFPQLLWEAKFLEYLLIVFTIV